MDFSCKRRAQSLQSEHLRVYCVEKSPSAPFAKAAFRSSASLCRQLLLLFRQVEERRLTLAPLALDA